MKRQNPLFPVFLKLEDLHTLIVGGGNVGLEKLNSIIRNSPQAKVTVVAPYIKEEILQLAEENTNIILNKKTFEDTDLKDKDLIIAATDNKELHKHIRKIAKEKKLLLNVADTPELCDFYLSSVVIKGDMKIAVSTNGKSPTLAKRFRELLEDVLPEDIPEILDNLQKIREELKGDFSFKLKALNELTSGLINKKS